MDRETEFDGWADLGARRRAEDEQLIQRYARGEGRGLPMRPVRAFVQHVRRDLGPKAIICDVRMTTGSGGHEVCASYYFPPDGAHAARAAPPTGTLPGRPSSRRDREAAGTWEPAQPAVRRSGADGPGARAVGCCDASHGRDGPRASIAAP